MVSIQFREFFRGVLAVRVRAAIEEMFCPVKRIQEFATALELVRGQRFVLHFIRSISLLLYRERERDTHTTLPSGGGGGFLSAHFRMDLENEENIAPF